MKIIKNVRVISPGMDIENAAVGFADGIFKEIYFSGNIPAGAELIDGGNMMMMPGFIDIHCHGRNGADFTDATFEAAQTIARGKLREGVTTVLPTTLTLPQDKLIATAQALAQLKAEKPGDCAQMPGLHLEGPFLNPECLGAQNPDFVRKANIQEVKDISEIFQVAKVSFAPECAGALDFTSELLAEHITPSCVHSAASYADFMKVYDRGLRNLSHFCNQMSALHHRDIGLVGCGLLYDDVFIELICDLIHISEPMIKLAFKVKGCDRIMLITDAMAASGLADGKSSIGGLEVIVKDGAARLAGSGALAGSTLQMNKALKNVYDTTGIELKELVKTTSWNQARATGFFQLGCIKENYLADFVLLDKDFEVKASYIAGECAWKESE